MCHSINLDVALYGAGKLTNQLAQFGCSTPPRVHVRHQILSEALSDPDYESEAMLGKKAALAIRILRRPRRGRTNSQRSSRTRLVSCLPSTAMNGARSRDLLFEPLMRRAADD